LFRLPKEASSVMVFVLAGAGETVLIAEEMAARNAVISLVQLTDSRPPLPLGLEGRKLELHRGGEGGLLGGNRTSQLSSS